tara:strand:+ start:718 stop:837 length:120 start_codon:yes stop_codon:yes gene_type:complete
MIEDVMFDEMDYGLEEELNGIIETNGNDSFISINLEIYE